MSTRAAIIIFSLFFCLPVCTAGAQVNDPPVLAGIEDSAMNYTEKSNPLPITYTITVSDTDDTNIEGATVRITDSYASGMDILEFTDTVDIDGTWNATTGTMTLTGADSLADYQTALQSVRYQNTSADPSLSTRTVTFTVNDGDDDSNSVTRDIQISAVNDQPVLAGLEGTALSYTENDAATALTASVTVTDVDDSTMEGATVRVSVNYANGQDVLAFQDGSGITGQWDAATGQLTLSGIALVATYETALRTVTYVNTSDDPSALTRTVSFQVNDGLGTSTAVTRDIDFTAENDPPELAGMEAAELAYTEDDGPAGITSALTLSDLDDTGMESATVQITGNYASGQDVLAFQDTVDIDGTWTAGTGTLTLSGTDSLADYQAALRAVTYQNTSDAPDTGTRTVTVTVNDGADDSASVTRDITVAAQNDAPEVANPIPDQNATEEVAFDYTVAANAFSDVDPGDALTYSATLHDDSALPEWLVFTAGTRNFNGTPANGDVGSIDVKVTAIDTSAAAVSDTFTLSVANVNDAPVVSDPMDDQDAWEDVAFSFTVPAGTFTDIDPGDSLTYAAAPPEGGDLPGWITFTAGTGTFSGTPLQADAGTFSVEVTATDEAEVSVSDTFHITVNAVNDPPVITGGAAGSYTSTGQEQIIDGEITVADVDDANLEGATVRVTTGFTAGEDVLAATTQGDIGAVYTPGTGVLTLSGTAAVDDYQASLRTVTYRNTNVYDPDQTARSFSFTVNDGDDSGSDTATLTVSDISPPAVSGVEGIDADGNGYLDRVEITFTEPLEAGQEDVSDWIVVDADGETDLLAGLTDDAMSSDGSVLTITLNDNTGTGGTPLCAYRSDGSGGALRDLTGNLMVDYIDPDNDGPVAAAGADQSVDPTVVQLSASGSQDADGHTLEYAWAQTGGPVTVTLAGAASARASFVARRAGTYTFALTVTDVFGVQDSDQVTVTVANVAPMAGAGADRILSLDVDTDAEITLDGSYSADPNSDTGIDDIASYAWTQTGGPSTVSIVDDGAATPQALFDSSVLAAGVYTFGLTVTDAGGLDSTDAVEITLHDPYGRNTIPSADAGVDQVAATGSVVRLDAHESRDADGDSLTYGWTRLSGPVVTLSGPATAQPTFVASSPGVYVFGLTVGDGTTYSGQDSVTVTVTGTSTVLPAAAVKDPAAGTYRSEVRIIETLGQTVTLEGTVLGDSSGITCRWTQLDGVPASLDSESWVTEVGPVTEGIYRFRLDPMDGTVTGKSAVVILTITGDNTPPAASAGTDQLNRQTGLLAALNGSASLDADGDPLSYAWRQTVGPAVVLSDPAAVTPNFIPEESGVYEFELVVSDGSVSSIPDRVYLVVHSPGNHVPTAEVDEDEIQAGVNVPVTLAASASADEDAADTLIYQWRQTEGPMVVLSDAFSVAPSFFPRHLGLYEFQVFVDDGNDRSIPDTVEVEVLAEAPEEPEEPAGGGGENPASSFPTGQCFIATASFGSPAAGEVRVFRSFRDRYLIHNATGRRIMAAYYRCSPPAAACIERQPVLKQTSRRLLRPLARAAELLMAY